MRSKNRLTLFLAIPIVVFFWFFGWSLYWIGSRNYLAKSGKRNSCKDLDFTVLMSEEQYAR